MAYSREKYTRKREQKKKKKEAQKLFRKENNQIKKLSLKIKT